MLYLLIGLLYWAINVFVRKLDNEGDYLLVLAWVLLWPIFFIAIIVNFSKKKYVSYQNRNSRI